jgi:hypothetical protein
MKTCPVVILSTINTSPSRLCNPRGEGMLLDLDDKYIAPFYSGKGKAIPLLAWTGPEGSWRLRLPDFKTIGT